MRTGRAARRAKPVISSGAKSFLTSRKLPPSTSESIKSYILKGLLCASGTISCKGRSLAGGTGSAAAGLVKDVLWPYGEEILEYTELGLVSPKRNPTQHL